MYSAAQVEVATVFCFLDDQDILPLPNEMYTLPLSDTLRVRAMDLGLLAAKPSHGSPSSSALREQPLASGFRDSNRRIVITFPRQRLYRIANRLPRPLVSPPTACREASPGVPSYLEKGPMPQPGKFEGLKRIL